MSPRSLYTWLRLLKILGLGPAFRLNFPKTHRPLAKHLDEQRALHLAAHDPVAALPPGFLFQGAQEPATLRLN